LGESLLFSPERLAVCTIKKNVHFLHAGNPKLHLKVHVRVAAVKLGFRSLTRPAWELFINAVSNGKRVRAFRPLPRFLREVVESV
jgi:hypothetical protein